MRSISSFHARQGFSSNDGVTRYGIDTPLDYVCIWEGATDATSNNSVSALINGLFDAGFAPEGVSKKVTSGNNKFGPKLKTALMKFQEAKGLLVDGVAGAGTWKALGVPNMLIRNCPYQAGKYPYGTKEPERPPVVDGVPAPPPPGGAGGDKKFYEEDWFLPAAFGTGVVTVALTIAFWPKKAERKSK
jgi:peptidoglycan hydrolase-like protein with peptidoglycan-binding domain